MSSETKPSEVRELYQQRLKLEKESGLAMFDHLKTVLVRELTFNGAVFDTFSERKNKFPKEDSEMAVRYRLLLEMLREATSPDQRLTIFAQWLLAERGVPPEESLGEVALKRLRSDALNRMGSLPLNDLRYANLIRIWLPYVERLFQDARIAEIKAADVSKRLQRLGYDNLASELFATKGARWRSRVEFTCQWLAQRGGIKMLKPREETDIAQTLRNAYSRIFGSGAPHLLTCIFCEEPAVGEFSSQRGVLAHHCEQHNADRLPTSSSEAWPDSNGRRWWRSGATIYCEPLPAPSLDK